MAIFKSLLTLRFKDQDLESKYTQVVFNNLKKFNKISTIVPFILLIIASALIYNGHQTLSDNHNHSYLVIMIISVLLLGLSLALCILILVCQSLTYKKLKWICYYNLINLYLSFSFSRFYLFYINKFDINLFHLLLFLEFAIRIVYVFNCLIGFLDSVLIGIILETLFLTVYSPIVQWWEVIPYSFGVYSMYVLFFIIYSYFFTKEKRTSFFYDQTIKKNVIWYETIFDKSNSGFLKISNNKIVFANKLVKSKFPFLNTTNVDLHATNTLNQMIESQDGDALYHDFINKFGEFFTGVDCTFINEEIIQDPILFTVNKSKSELTFEKMKKHYLDLKEDNFTQLGVKTFQISNEISSFDIYYRYYQENEEDNYEFILNDITRAKEKEKKNAEFKYKTLFLAKVVHEFKNPLLCISEIADSCKEISEQIESNKNQAEINIEELKEKLFLISSFSKYLVVLTKDLDFYSNSNSNSDNVKINNSTVNVNEVLKLVEEISNGLIIKNNKQDNIKFIIEKEEHTPEKIDTDEVKLKQVLINLCSNAVKFTNLGQVKLNIKPEKDWVKFTVIDTGTGMSQERMSNLFKPFSTEINNRNLLGTGLGLSIVNDITKKFGSPIEYSSVLGKGSQFWFKIPYRSDQAKVSRRESKLSVIPNRKSEKSISNSVVDSQQLNDSKATIRKDSVVLCIDYSKLDLAVLNSSKEITIIIADDDRFIRSSAVKVLTKAGKTRNFKLNIIEVDDGNGIISQICQSNKMGKSVDIVLSDETMTYLGGCETYNILQHLLKDNKIKPFDFYLITSYDPSNFKSMPNVLSKPLNNEMVLKILDELELD